MLYVVMSDGEPYLSTNDYDLVNKKYFNERTNEDRAVHFKKLDNEYRKLVKDVLLKERDFER